jgi:hypothetical protein
MEPHLQQACSLAAGGVAAMQLPVFISDPEPGWLTNDVKQRYSGLPLGSSRVQAMRCNTRRR